LELELAGDRVAARQSHGVSSAACSF